MPQLFPPCVESLRVVHGVGVQDGAVEVVDLSTKCVDTLGVVEVIKTEPDEVGFSVGLAVVDAPPVLPERPRDFRDDVAPLIFGDEGAVAASSAGGASVVAASATTTFFSASLIWSIFRPACAAIAINILGVQDSRSSGVALG
jgi:hypothetical protein